MCQWIGEEVKDGADTPRIENREENENEKKENEINNGNTGDGNSSSGKHSVEREHSDDGKHTWREAISEKFSNISREDIKNGAIKIAGKIYATLASGVKDVFKAVLSPVTINRLEVLKTRFLSEAAPQFIKGFESIVEGFRESFLGETVVDTNSASVDNEPKSESTEKTNTTDTGVVNNNQGEQTDTKINTGGETQEKAAPVEKLTPEQREARAEYRAAIEEYKQYNPEGVIKVEEFLKIPEESRGTYETVTQIYREYKEGKISYEEYKDKMDKSTAQASVLEIAITRMESIRSYDKIMTIATDPYEGMAKQNEDGSFTIERDLKGSFARFEHIPEGTVLPSVESFREAQLSEIAQMYTDLMSGNISTDDVRDKADDLKIGDFREQLGEYDGYGRFHVYEEFRLELHNPNSEYHKEAGEPFVTDDYSLQGITKIIGYNTQDAMEIRAEQEYIRRTFYDD